MAYKQKFKLGRDVAPGAPLAQIQGNNVTENRGKFGHDGGDLLDFDGDGDTIFNDSNNDGTMLSRGLTSAYNAIKRGATSSDAQAGKAKATQDAINNKFKSDFKEKGFVQAIKDNFKFN